MHIVQSYSCLFSGVLLAFDPKSLLHRVFLGKGHVCGETSGVKREEYLYTARFSYHITTSLNLHLFAPSPFICSYIGFSVLVECSE